MGDVSRFPRGKAGGQLSGPDSARALLGGTAEAGCDHQAGQPHAAHVAGGSGAGGGGARSRIAQAVSPPLSSETQSRGQVAVARKLAVRLYWMLHERGLSRDRSHREQPAGAPGRRKLDRRIDWALSHPVETGCSHRRIMAAVSVESMVGGTIFH